jgi:hypothetical protein
MVFGLIFTVVTIAFACVIMDMQSQMAQKNEQLQALQDQITLLEKDLGTTKKGAWNVVTSFGGASGFTSDYFYVSGTELRLNWAAYTSADQSVVFSMFLYTEGKSEPLESFTNLQEQGTVFIQNIEKGNYYLDVSENNADQWGITVETWIPPE